MTRLNENEVPPPAYNAYQAPLTNDFSLNVASDGTSLLVTITPPTEPVSESDDKKAVKRAPVDLCCVIDVSGSMGDHAPAPTGDGVTREKTGLSVLDITKHAMKTIIATLQEDDRLAIVTFSGTAKTIKKLTQLTEQGRKSLDESIDKLRPLDSTNLWDGLRHGMDLLNEVPPETQATRLSSIFLLTDGQPNVEPPRGHIPMLRQYLERNPTSHFSISTFGFGYNLDSQLLSQLSTVGDGGYGFIPDSGMVGTVFVHALSNLASTYASGCKLGVELPEGYTLKSPRGKFPVVNASWGSTVNFGDLQYGQSREILLEIEPLVKEGESAISKLTSLFKKTKLEDSTTGEATPTISITVTAKPWFTDKPISKTIHDATSSAEDVSKGEYYNYHVHRLELVDKMFTLSIDPAKADQKSNYNSYSRPLPNLELARKEFKSMTQTITSTLASYPAAVALAEDIGGEVSMAVENESNWRKWGQHYFPSLARSYQRQQCSNFKDPGLQVFGANSPLFIKLRDDADATFDKIPVPKPSIQAHGGQKYSAPASMAVYNSRHGPCFAGDCTVLLADGGVVRLDGLRRGMAVETPMGAKLVAAVVKTEMVGGQALLCKIGDLKVTPWHPIFHDGQWSFPADLVQPEMFECPAIYSLMLQQDSNVETHAVEINGVRAVTLGHGLSSGSDIRAHPFFGSYNRVMEELAHMQGFHDTDGVVVCEGIIRGADGLITGFLRSHSQQGVVLDAQTTLAVTA